MSYTALTTGEVAAGTAWKTTTTTKIKDDIDYIHNEYEALMWLLGEED